VEAVCFECECVLEAGKTVLTCSTCRRRFHESCAAGHTNGKKKKKKKKNEDWECSLCSLKVVRCSTCKGLELAESAAFCGHDECARAACSKCSDGADWKCEGHVCHSCGEGLRPATNWVCVRCPVAFCETCRPPPACFVLADRVFKCVKHLKDPLLQQPDPVAILEWRRGHTKRKRDQQAETTTTKKRTRAAAEDLHTAASLKTDIQPPPKEGPLSIEDMMRNALSARARESADDAGIFGLPSLADTLESTDVALPPRHSLDARQPSPPPRGRGSLPFRGGPGSPRGPPRGPPWQQLPPFMPSEDWQQQAPSSFGGMGGYDAYRPPPVCRSPPPPPPHPPYY